MDSDGDFTISSTSLLLSFCSRHGFRLCPLTNADANKLKLDFDELRGSVASQSVAVAGDGGGSVLCMTLCIIDFLLAKRFSLATTCWYSISNQS